MIDDKVYVAIRTENECSRAGFGDTILGVFWHRQDAIEWVRIVQGEQDLRNSNFKERKEQKHTSQKTGIVTHTQAAPAVFTYGVLCFTLDRKIAPSFLEKRYRSGCVRKHSDEKGSDE